MEQHADDHAGQPQDGLQQVGDDARQGVASQEQSPQTKTPRSAPVKESKPQDLLYQVPNSARSNAATDGWQKKGPVGKSLLNLSTLRRAPQYSFRVSKDRFTSRAQTAAAQVPGPGAYSPTAEISPRTSRHASSPRMVFGTSSRDVKARQSVPGPGAYADASASFVGKGSAFSVTPRREKSIINNNGCIDAPGPGSHNVPGIIGKSGPKYSASPRLTPLKPDNYRGPGPGQYSSINEAHNKLQRSDPSWGFGSARRPGPPVREAERIVPGIRGKSTAAGLVSKLPGPGTYDSQSLVGEGPKYSLGARRASPRPQLSPGPGETAGPFTTFA
eukprot:TRINITY_DN17348_c0_g1_i1.p1 TRINITY_DN17348_c0_g1~~TRINITY_DN17348_c0_g1_i1.p1  ORF type:complete len:330 (+),score=40.41 TRINITY_DN17348_c0_g1_i1:29-1018(+)